MTMVLMDARANVNAENNDGCTTLYFTNLSLNSIVLEFSDFLKKSDFDVTESNDGKTPLHFARYTMHFAVNKTSIEPVNFLQPRGAEVN